MKSHLTDFLKVYGILLNDLKILVLPRDQRMRELIALQAIGLSPIEAVRYYLALQMAERGLVSAPNAAIGAPFQVGGAPYRDLASPWTAHPAPRGSVPDAAGTG